MTRDRLVTFAPLGSLVALATISLGLGALGASKAPTRQKTYRQRFDDQQKDFVVSGNPGGSCGGAGSNCHVGGQSRPGELLLGDEYPMWYQGGLGSHVKAYEVLESDPRSAHMLRLLEPDRDIAPTEYPLCLSCHSLPVDAYADSALAVDERKGRRFQKEQGVSCEACHGFALGRPKVSGDSGTLEAIAPWQSLHFTPSWRRMSTEEKTAHGFYDIRHLERRAEKCLECHLGSERKEVSHDLMAAGHPDLSFELATDLEDVPRHWRDEPSYLWPEEGAYFKARAWAVGQTVQLREALLRVERWARSDRAPDFALFDCQACHHELRDDTSRAELMIARRKTDFLRGIERALGEPFWNGREWAVSRYWLKELVEGDTGAQANLETLEGHIRQLVQHLSLHPSANGRLEVAKAARDSVVLLQPWIDQTVETRFDRALVLRLLNRLCAEAEEISLLGYRSAQQAYRALDALYRQVLHSEDPPNDAVLERLDSMRKQLHRAAGKETPEHYDAFSFAKSLGEFRAVLPD